MTIPSDQDEELGRTRTEEVDDSTVNDAITVTTISAASPVQATVMDPVGESEEENKEEQRRQRVPMTTTTQSAKVTTTVEEGRATETDADSLNDTMDTTTSVPSPVKVASPVKAAVMDRLGTSEDDELKEKKTIAHRLLKFCKCCCTAILLTVCVLLCFWAMTGSSSSVDCGGDSCGGADCCDDCCCCGNDTCCDGFDCSHIVNCNCNNSCDCCPKTATTTPDENDQSPNTLGLPV